MTHEAMKILRTLILIFLIPFTIVGQDFMTIGDVFDFEIGNEFQIEGRGQSQPPNADRIKIIDKYYSADSNTVFYVRFHDSYYVFIENYEAHYVFWTETDTVSYTNLDTCITHSNYWISYDTSMISYDTINSNATVYCDSLLNGFYYEINPFEPSYYSNIYGKGLGMTRNYYNNPAENMMFDNILFYYKKNGVSCGIPDSITVSLSEKKDVNVFKIYPIPARDFLNIENKTGTEIESIFITNINGQVLEQFDASITHLNVSRLPSGIYILKIASKKGEFKRKIIKL